MAGYVYSRERKKKGGDFLKTGRHLLAPGGLALGKPPGVLGLKLTTRPRVLPNGTMSTTSAAALAPAVQGHTATWIGNPIGRGGFVNDWESN